MTDDISVAAWEAFSRDPSDSVKKASVREQLDTIAAQVNELKINSERSAQLIPGLMADANAIGQSNTEAQPPEGGMPGMPGMGGAPPGAPPMPGMDGEEEMPEDETEDEVESEDETGGRPGDDEFVVDEDPPALVYDDSEEGETPETEGAGGDPELDDAFGDDEEEELSEEYDDTDGLDDFPMTDAPLEDDMPSGQTDGATGLSTPDENASTAFYAFRDRMFDAAMRARDSGNVEQVKVLVTAFDAMRQLFETVIQPALDGPDRTDAVTGNASSPADVEIAPGSIAGGSGIGIAKSGDAPMQAPDAPKAPTAPVAPVAGKEIKAIAKEFGSAVGEKPDKTDRFDSAVAKGKRMTTVSADSSVKKSAEAVQRPSATASMNGAFARPSLGDAAHTPKSFREMMDEVKSGKRPRDAVAPDLERYKVIHGRRRP